MMLAWLSSSLKKTAFLTKRGKDADIRHVARIEEERRLRPLERRQLLFQLRVQRKRARRQPRAAGTAAVALDGLLRRPLEARMIDEPKVVVRRQEQLFSTADRDVCGLRRVDLVHLAA